MVKRRAWLFFYDGFMDGIRVHTWHVFSLGYMFLISFYSPCQVNSFGNDTVRNPYSWNTAANVVFLDQPVNVGYSYGKTKVKNSKESARDVYAFLQLFFSEYTKYAKSPFHLSGESYGGHYLPSISSEIIRHNKDILEEHAEDGPIKINLESVLIGNGWTEPRTQFKHYETYSCAEDSVYKPIFDKHTCKQMREKTPRCNALMDACYKYPGSLTCIPASYVCGKIYQDPFFDTGLNPYDIRRKCEGDTGLCYDLIEAIEQYANLEQVREDLGVDEEAGKYTGCNDGVGYRFAVDGDKYVIQKPENCENVDYLLIRIFFTNLVD